MTFLCTEPGRCNKLCAPKCDHRLCVYVCVKGGHGEGWGPAPAMQRGGAGAVRCESFVTTRASLVSSSFYNAPFFDAGSNMWGHFALSVGVAFIL